MADNNELSDAELEAKFAQVKSAQTPAAKVQQAQAAVQSNSYDPALQTGNISKSESVRRGIASGGLAGFEPQISGVMNKIAHPLTNGSYSDKVSSEKLRNDQAFKQNPLAYGAGYTGGAVSLGLLTGGLGDLALAGRGATAASEVAPAASRSIGFLADMSPAVPEAAPTANTVGQTLKNFLSGAAETAAHPFKITTGKIAQSAASAAGSQVNQLDDVDLPDAPQIDQDGLPLPTPKQDPSKAVMGSPISYADPETNKAMQTASSAGDPSTPTNSDPTQFGTLLDWLKSAQASNNPDVNDEASAAMNSLNQDPNNNDLKRQLAMQMQTTQNGRAVMNDDSPLNG
jgi:hypothetical protein